MAKIKLSDICNPKQWKTIPTSDLLEEGYPVYGANGIIGYYSEFNHENPVITVTCRGATCGSINITVPKAYVTGNAMCLDDVRSDIEIEYLYYCLRHYNFSNVISGSAQPQITRQSMDKIYVTICTRDEQIFIVNKLKKVEKIIEFRKQELQALENLIKARFVEMFGDVKINPHKYKKNSIKSVLKTCEAGWSGNGTQRIRKDDEIAVLKVSAVTKGYFIPEECKVLDDQENIKKYVTPEKGDLLFSRANTREMVGATAIVKEDYPSLILPDKLWKIKFRDNVNVFYMKYVLSSKSVRNQFSVVSTGTSGSMYNVSMDKFKAIEVPLPPIELQNQFADFVHQVDKSKVAVQINKDTTQELLIIYIFTVNKYYHK
jgi:type I restriction enzyme S subunit